MPEFKASRLEEGDPVQARSISSPWISDVVTLAWITVELKTMARLLYSTNKQEENIKVGVSTKHGYWVDIIGQLKIGNSIYIDIIVNQL